MTGSVRDRSRGVGAAVLVIAAAAIAASLGCASATRQTPSAGAKYFQNPDRVWQAVMESLETLGYEVEQSNRDEGTIRALPAAGDGGVALAIDQVMRTDDQVSVYVKPYAADPAEPPDEAAMDRASRDLLAVLGRKLGS